MSEQLMYSPKQIAEKMDPTGEVGITARSVRTEIDNGKLKATKFAGKIVILHNDLMERIGGDKWQKEAPDRGSPSSSRNDTPNPSTSSDGMKADKSASVQQARASSKRLKRLSKTSSPKDTNGQTAQVIPMQS